MHDIEGPAIRPARPDDAGGIAAVLRDLGWFAHIDDEPESETAARVGEQVARCAADGSHMVIVAEAGDGQVVGYAAVHWFPNLMKGGDGYISELFLREAARGQGTGARLLDAIEREAARRGINRLMLFNRTERASYQRAFYPKHGFEERTDVAFFTKMLGKV
jgi:GNAT superfamily N-acetyltransferase